MTDTQRVSMPGRLIGVLVVLVIQLVGNGFIGWLLVSELNEDASHGADVDGGLYFLGYLSLAVAALLAVCFVCTIRPRPWARPMIITIEAVSIISGLVNLVNGAVGGLLGIVIAGVVIATLLNEESVEWYRR